MASAWPTLRLGWIFSIWLFIWFSRSNLLNLQNRIRRDLRQGTTSCTNTTSPSHLVEKIGTSSHQMKSVFTVRWKVLPLVDLFRTWSLFIYLYLYLAFFASSSDYRYDTHYSVIVENESNCDSSVKVEDISVDQSRSNTFYHNKNYRIRFRRFCWQWVEFKNFGLSYSTNNLSRHCDNSG